MTTWLFRRFLFSERTGALVRFIAWLSIAGIGVGVFSIVLVMSVMNGFNQSLLKRTFAVEPHLVIELESERDHQKWLEARSQWLGQNPDVQSYEYEEQDVIIKTVDGFFSGAVAKGVDEASLKRMLQKSVGQGMLPGDRLLLEDKQIVMGIDLARSLQIYEGDEITVLAPESLLLPPGETPRLERLTVMGFLSTYVPAVDESSFFYLRGGQSLKQLGLTASFHRGVELRTTDPMLLDDEVKSLKKIGFQAETWKERNSSLVMALMLERTMIGIFLALSTLVASFSIITVLVLLSTQKKKEFGVLMAMGLSARSVQKIFIKLGLYLSGLGIGSGLFLGTAASLYIQKYPLDVLPSIYQDSRIPALVDFKFILLVALGAVLLAVLASWFPSRKMLRLTPVEAFRS